MLEREPPCDRHLVQGVRHRERMGLAGVVLRLRSDDVLHAAERQEVPQFRGVHVVGGGRGELGPGASVRESDALDLIPAHVHADGLALVPDGEASGGAERSEHRLQHRHRDARLVAQAADGAEPGVEVDDLPGPGGQRVVGPVVLADGPPERGVGLRAPVPLDPRILVQRHALHGELPAWPVRGLGEQNPQPQTGGGQRRRHPPEPGPGDDDVVARHRAASRLMLRT